MSPVDDITLLFSIIEQNPEVAMDTTIQLLQRLSSTQRSEVARMITTMDN